MPWGEGITLPGPWGALSQDDALRHAANPSLGPLHIRVFLMAVARCNTTGHAEFAPGELATLLPRRAEQDAPVSRTHLTKAIARAVRDELLLAGSGTRCLLPSPTLWDRAGGRGSRTCTWHGPLFDRPPDSRRPETERASNTTTTRSRTTREHPTKEQQ